jgi:hypothetical protein
VVGSPARMRSAISRSSSSGNGLNKEFVICPFYIDK